MSGEDVSHGFKVGQRVLDKKGNAGTVMYIGPVATSKSAETTYVGLQWDDPTRGKGDGSVTTADGETVRYFTTGPTQGSFLKTGLVDKGVSFIAALLDRYEGSSLSDMGGAGTVDTASGGLLEVEFVGEDHIRAKQRLARNRNVALRACKVATIDGGGAIATACPNIEDLDLRDNLLYDFAQLAPLGQQLPRLSVLNLSGNMMLPCSPAAAEAMRGHFNALRVLVLSRTGLRWQDVVTAANTAPLLEELHASENGLSVLSSGAAVAAAVDGATGAGGPPTNPAEDPEFEFVEGLEKLKVLNLSSNAVSSWREVWRLSRLPALEQLLLNDNKIAELDYWYPPGADAPVPFRSLKFISLASNAVASWDVVDRLARFPSLEALRFQRNPVLESAGPSEMRMTLIARLASLKTLNGSEVRPRERSDAEKMYLRRAGDVFAQENGLSSALEAFGAGAAALESEASAGGAGAASAGGAGGEAQVAPSPADVPTGTHARDSDLAKKLLAHNPRYFELLDKHGHVLVAAAAEGSSTLASSVVKVTLRSMAAASCTEPAVERRLPLSMTVGNLKVMLNKLFKCEVSMQRLSFREAGKGTFPNALDDDMQTLSYFGVRDKGEILMEEIDPREAAREKSEKEAELARRMEQQLKAGEALRRHEQQAAAAQRAGAKAAAGQ